MSKVRGSHLLHGALVALALMAAAGPAAAQWKWKDANGSVQYSDRPPPAGTPESAILSRPSGSSRLYLPTAPAAPASAASAPPAKDPQLEARKREQDEAEAAKKRAEDEQRAKQRAENCQRARSYARTLEDGVRIARTNDKGEREILDDAQRAQEITRTKQVISADCSN